MVLDESGKGRPEAKPRGSMSQRRRLKLVTFLGGLMLVSFVGVEHFRLKSPRKYGRNSFSINCSEALG